MSSCVVWLFGGNYNIAIVPIEQRLFCDYNIILSHSNDNKKKTQRHIHTKTKIVIDRTMVMKMWLLGSYNANNHIIQERWSSSSNTYMKF